MYAMKVVTKATGWLNDSATRRSGELQLLASGSTGLVPRASLEAQLERVAEDRRARGAGSRTRRPRTRRRSSDVAVCVTVVTGRGERLHRVIPSVATDAPPRHVDVLICVPPLGELFTSLALALMKSGQLSFIRRQDASGSRPPSARRASDRPLGAWVAAGRCGWRSPARQAVVGARKRLTRRCWHQPALDRLIAGAVVHASP